MVGTERLTHHGKDATRGSFHFQVGSPEADKTLNLNFSSQFSNTVGRAFTSGMVIINIDNQSKLMTSKRAPHAVVREAIDSGHWALGYKPRAAMPFYGSAREITHRMR